MADTFEQDKKIENNLADYDYLVSNANLLVSQVTAWNGKFDALRADVPATKQAELDTKKIVFTDALKAALGL